MRGWVVNDCLTALPGAHTIWMDLLEWFPGLEDRTNGYTDYTVLAQVIEQGLELATPRPDILIRNATFFPPIRTKIPQIAFLQDVAHGFGRAVQVDVCRKAGMVVFNSPYTKAEYSELDDVPQRMIPIGIDFDRFAPVDFTTREALRKKWGIPENAICFIGSSNAIKGFNQIIRLINDTTLNFCLIMKDDFSLHVPGRVVTFNKIPHVRLPELINACVAGVCTSIRETQHLAGLEMGACGLPLVVSDVGIYHGRRPGAWGMAVEPFEFAEALAEVSVMQPASPARDYWIREGLTLAGCKQRWAEAIEAACGVSPLPS